MSDLALELVGLKRSFTQGEVTIDVLRGVDAHLKRGEIVALLGPSGSGKSTMLQAVGLLEGGFDGTIRIDGADVTQYEQGERTKTRREKIGFVYQFHHLLPDFNAIENVVLPQLIRGAGQAVVAFSAPMEADLVALKAFLMRRVYRSRRVMDVMDAAQGVVARLFGRYLTDASALPPAWQTAQQGLAERARARVIADFVAGMTDRYALAEHARLFDGTPELR